ncbi:MAG: hypothetical protein R6U95_01060 [Bacteroidales bacterium]
MCHVKKSTLDIDQALISKSEQWDRKNSKEQINQFADFFGFNKEKLLIAWLSNKIIYDLQDEIRANRALKVAEHKIKYKRKTM